MNQILFTQNTKQNSSKADINKIILFFVIFLMLFGIIMAVSGGINVYKKSAQKQAKQTQTTNENTLQVPVITEPEDPNNSEIDETKPKIQITVSGNYAKIKATDETELDYITYKWNDEEETKIYAPQEDETTIQESVEILRGQNRLTVLAVDKAGNQYQTVKTYEGITKPVIDVVQEGNELVIKVTDEEGIDYVYYNLNGKEYKLRTEATQKELEYRQAMDEGDNRISMEAYNIKGEKTTFEGIAHSL